MKNAIKLLILAGALLSVGALAQSTGYNFYFPAYAAIYTNVDQVDFFNSTVGTEGALYQNSVSGYYEGTAAGVLKCIDDNLSTFTGSSLDVSGSTSSTASITCNFAPDAVTKNTTFSVTGYSNAGSPPTDGELLIITNSSTFNVGVTVNSNGITDATIYAMAGYVDTTPSVQTNNSNGLVTSDVTNVAFTQDDAFDTQYTNAKVIPLVFYASVDVLSVGQITTAQSADVTWTASAP
ncbi:hypothetical protein [Oceanithermus sp.]